MLIGALCDYADKLAEKGENQIPDGWSEQNIHYRIMLTPEGKIADIIDVRIAHEIPQKNGKVKTVYDPRKIILPLRTQKTAIDSNIIEHRPSYIFGLDFEGDSFNSKDNKAKKSNAAFVKRNIDFFEGLDSEMCQAYLKFVQNWSAENETDNPALAALGKNYKGSYFGFGLTGARGNLEDDEQFKQRYAEHWQKENKADSAGSDDDLVICGILGEKLKAARIHDKIKFPGGNSTGCVLVGMKESAFESYGKKQSYNSNISELAMKKYTSALNKLLADPKHHKSIADMVIVYFAMKKDDSAECDLFSMMMSDSSDAADESLHSLFKLVSGGGVNNLDAFNVDENVTFYVAGLTANSSRLCQKFICRDKFGNIVKNLVQHQADLKIDPENKHQVFFRYIADQLVSPKSSNEKVSPPLMTGIMLSALGGTNYPNALLETAVRRVKTDSDEDNNHFIKLNDTRAGIIKACINRKLRISGQKEEIEMSLDKNNKNPAYLCGRLFAVYEKIQQDSSGGGLNRTIKDSYFASACARPSAIMTKLSQLSQNHMRKLEEGKSVYYNKLIGEIMDGLNGEFPQTQDLDSQGRFIIGYYQQNKDLYTKKTNDGKEE